jgi:hypothetical protein
MRLVGDYEADDYAHVAGLVSPEVAQAFLQALKHELGEWADHAEPASTCSAGRPSRFTASITRRCFSFSLGRTPYDRPSYEHSLSMTLDYSDA